MVVSLVFTEPAWREGTINWEATAARMKIRQSASRNG